MFTGIVESMALVKEVVVHGSNHTFWVESGISSELHVDQSVAHNGICLTVEEISKNRHRVTAVAETLLKSNAGSWVPGTPVNLERCLPLNGRLDGHFVQGHVDTTATCLDVRELNGSWEYRFRFPEIFSPNIIEKGSICLDGISLTAFHAVSGEFSVAVIPYTYQHTNLQHLIKGSSVNIEFDMVGKYILRYLQTRQI